MEARKARQGGRNTDTVCKTKKGPPKLLGGPFQKINRYAIEASHSTMQLFRNG